jgi:hypothetical protein
MTTHRCLPCFVLMICLMLIPVHHAMAASQAEDTGEISKQW